MGSAAILAVVSVIALSATGGAAIATGMFGNAGWHMPSFGQTGFDGDGMMGGRHMGNGMMGGGSPDGAYDGYQCPMYSNWTAGYGNWTQMPCWGDNQSLTQTSGGPSCQLHEYCWNQTSGQSVVSTDGTCHGYDACPGTTYSAPAADGTATDPIYNMPCH